MSNDCKTSAHRILFISHDASRTGAPFCLLHLLLWLSNQTNVSTKILLRSSGPLRHQFLQFGEVLDYRTPLQLWKRAREDGLPQALRHWSLDRAEQLRAASEGRVRLKAKDLLTQIREFQPHLIYSNTVVNGDLLQILSPINCPVISHIHEMRNIIDLFGTNNWHAVHNNTTKFIAASSAVKSDLVEIYAVSPEKVEVVYEFIPVQTNEQPKIASQEMRARLGIGEKDFIVCGSGLDEWRKGTDLFIRCAEAVKKHSSGPVSFVWVGGWLSEQARSSHLELARSLGVSDSIRFTGMVENPRDYFATADVFALTSREDPFPLVCLEAASLGKPVLCFSRSGGMPDFVEEDAGFVIPHEDHEAMAERILQLMNDRELMETLGRRAQRKVRERHDVSVGARQILEIIQGEISSINSTELH